MNTRIVKIGRNILFMLSVPAIISAFVFADVTTRNEVCKGVQISFMNNRLSFVTKQNISDILQANHIIAHKTRLRNIQINELEKSIEENKWVKNADIFVLADNSIHIRIAQKSPVVRIQPDNDFEDPYYLDEYGNSIPYSAQYVPDLPVVTAPALGYTSADLAMKSDLVKLAKFITQDTFWHSAITQISVDSVKSITLIPAFGHQQIIIGKVTDLDNKMSKLFQFYRQGYHTVNWDKYDEIDLRFERQVVCRNTRGERISVDPYDKTTHKEILAIAKANEEKKIADDAIVNTAVVKIVPHPAAATVAILAKSKSAAPAETVKAGAKISEKLKTPVRAKTPKPENEKAIAKHTTAESLKGKTEKKEAKSVMTEVQNSKYFK